MIEQLQSEERNIGVEANITTGLAPQITLEIPQATSELFEDDDLCLDVANLLRDNPIKDDLVRHFRNSNDARNSPLRNLLDDGKLLLDDGYLSSLAYLVLLHDDDSIVPSEAIEIVDSEKVVKTGQRRKPSPVIKRDI